MVASVDAPVSPPASGSVVAADNKAPLPMPPLQSNTAGNRPRTTAPAKPTLAGAGSSAGGLASESLRSNPSQQRWESVSLPMVEREAIFASLAQQVSQCRKCEQLACTRKKTVFGDGKLQPRVVFFGEAPGADEDAQGLPFVGRAGQLLTKIIQAAQMNREDVYILNSIKCRPPNNRLPSEMEMENCKHFFEQQLEVLQPEYIVCLGAVAVRAVLNTTESIGRLRGRFHQYKGAKVLVTYHPAYLLRNEDAKKFTWSDIQFLMRAMGIEIPGKKS